MLQQLSGDVGSHVGKGRIAISEPAEQRRHDECPVRLGLWVPETRPWSLTCCDAESSCTESCADSWSQDEARNPWSAPRTE